MVHHVGWLTAVWFVVLTGCNVTSSGHNMYGKQLYDQGQYAAAIQAGVLQALEFGLLAI